MRSIYLKFAVFALVAFVASYFFSGFNMSTQMALASSLACAVVAMSPHMRLDGFGVGLRCDDITAELVRLSSEFKTTSDGLKEMGGELKAKHEAGERVTAQLKESVDALMTKFNGLATDIKDLEQKAASGIGAGGANKVKSAGEQFIESDGFKSFNPNDRTAVKATITTTLAGGAAGSGLMSPAYRDTDLVRIPRRVTVDDLIPSITIDTSSVDYAKQLTRNNLAAMVAEGAQKPYSDYSWSSETVPVRVLAHLAKVTRQAWEDAPRLMGEINSELIYGLDLLREAQILFGNGTGQNLHGIVPQATAYAAPTGAPTTGLTKVDVLRLSILNLMLRGYQADGIVLNSADWAYIELLKDTLGRYILGDPQSDTVARLWKLPVLDTPALTQDNFLVGAFRIGATYYRRMGIEIKLSTENSNDFELNLGTIRAEERGALAVKRPDAFETGTFTAAIAAE